MILLKKILSEISFNKSYEILLGVFREMPDYVFDDFVMSDKGFFQKELNKILKQNPNADEDDVAEQFSDWVKINWKLKVLEVNPSDFTKDNLKNMIRRKFGDANPGKIPNDEKRIAFQRNLAKKLKPGTNEPVIVLNKGSQYRLLEGWHRTMAILSLGNNGEEPTKWGKIKLRAWVGTGSTIKNVW